MAIENEPGGLDNIRQQLAAHAEALKSRATAALRQKAAEFREVIGPQKLEQATYPERPFGRDEGGQDVKQVVWTGHTVQTPEGREYFGAAGLTQGGYYRAAEVQIYGSDELWRWQWERYADRENAIAEAERMADMRLRGETPANGAEPAWRDFFEKEKANMAELPEHLKAEADKATANLDKGSTNMKDAGAPVYDNADAYDAKAMEAQRAQQRQNALDRKGPEPDR